MANLIFATPLYLFLRYCSETNLERIVLDCGAGGEHPPLSLFHEAGYQAYGIELSEGQLKAAQDFSKKNNSDLKLALGSMCELPFDDRFFSFLYSWNTTVHMEKSDVEKALHEFHRVLIPEGLCYINFLSYECDTYGIGDEVRIGEFEVPDGEGTIQFSHYRQSEIEEMLFGFEIIYCEHRVITRKRAGKSMVSGFYDYILRKYQ